MQLGFFSRSTTRKMREKFFEYYPMTQKELSAFWDSSLLVLDTNVLLNLYRYTESSRKDILGILKNFNDKLWMPFQVGREYHNNRETVIDSVYGLENIIGKQVKNSFDTLGKAYRSEYSRNPFLSADAWEKKLDKAKDSLIKYVSSCYKGAPDLRDEDTILLELNQLYSGRIGDGFTSEEQKKIFEEGKIRYAAEVPPGYKDQTDKKNRGERHLYGDLIIWKEIIRKAKTDKKCVFFVTEDLKEDWMRIVNGEKRGPRWELLREFYNETDGQRVIIMSLDRFVSFIHDLPDYAVKPKTIKEVEDVQRDDIRSLGFDAEEMRAFIDAISSIRREMPETELIRRRFQAISQFDLNKYAKQIESLSKTASAFPVSDLVHDEIDTPGAEDFPLEGEDAQEK